MRKGEKGSLVVYADTITRTEQNEKGEDVERQFGFMKGYTVFCLDQIEGLPAHFYAKAGAFKNPDQRNAEAEAFFANTGATISHGGNAYYAPGPDFIQMPDFESFRDAVSYYSNLAHEAVHWIRHKSRLDRDFGRKKWGDEGYAMEECVAERGAAFLCADLELTPQIREDHASYLAGWVKVLKADRRAIFTASRSESRPPSGRQPKEDQQPESGEKEAA